MFCYSSLLLLPKAFSYLSDFTITKIKFFLIFLLVLISNTLYQTFVLVATHFIDFDEVSLQTKKIIQKQFK